MPVVSLGNGATLGSIDHVYFDPQRLAVVGFTVQHGNGLFGGSRVGLVDIADVHAFGPDAVTIDDVAVVHSDVALEPRRADLLDLEALLHRTVMTAGGERLGHVVAILFGDASFRLVGLDVAEPGIETPLRISAEAIQTIGDDWIIVAEPEPAVTASTPPRRKPVRVLETAQTRSPRERDRQEAMSA
jgi:uncharacterized protein YrrD